jgi:hypothetical protein
MRRSLYLILMFVLILRGLAGTAMAAGVLPPLLPMGVQHAQVKGPHAPQASAAEAALQAHNLHAASTTADGDGPDESHAGHAAGATAASPCGGGCPEGAAEHEHEHPFAACSACEICHSAMLDMAPPALPPIPAAGSHSPLAPVPFASAPTALAVKPPIA